MTDLIKGIDISTIQGKVDFVACANAGLQFVICRCGVGNGGIDRNYAQNIASARSAGLKVACYHFLYPLPPQAGQPLRDPIKQAQYHFNASLGELACIDCEWPAPEDFAKWGCSPTQLNQWMLTYLQEYERLSGRKPVIYTYPYWASAVKFDPKFAEYPLWIASYQASPLIPHPWTDFVLWQDSSGPYHLPGTGVVVDTDKAKDLSLWGASDAPAVVAPPVPEVVVSPTPPADPAPSPAPVAPPPVVAITTPNVPTAFNLLHLIIQLLSGLFKKFFKR